MTGANIVSYSAQIAVLVFTCAALPRVLGLRSPGIQYLFWRALFAICVLLPLLQPWRHELMEFVAAPSGPALLSAAATPTNPAPAHSFIPRLSLTVVGALLLAGIGARLAWLSAGVLRLRWMRDNATDMAESFGGLQQTIGVVADIRWSRVVRHPVTFGVIHPIVLLPLALRTADDSAQRAVVAHELHHVKRCDWAWVVGEEIVRSIFWFHPAMWWLVSRVQLARETVVDELSILTTNARRAYLDALLTFADDTGVASTPAFSARRHLFHRVMLLSKEENMSSSRVAFTSCLLVVALGSGAWGAVHAYPLSMTVVSIVPGAAARDQNLAAEQNTPPQTRTTPGQLPPPPRDPTPTPPQPPPSSRQLSPAADIPESFRNTVELLHPVRVGANVKPPTKIHDVRPVFPAEARAHGVQGVVIIETIIDADGGVADAYVLRSIPMLDAAALDAVRQWKFARIRLNDEPTAVIMTVTVNFTLTAN